jgi:hypothetical protein
MVMSLEAAMTVDRHLGVVVRDRGGDALQDAGLAGLGRRDDQAALAAAERGDDVDAAPGGAVAVGRVPLAGQQLEDEALRRVERRARPLQVAEHLEAAPLGRLVVPATATAATGAAAALLTRALLAGTALGARIGLGGGVAERAAAASPAVAAAIAGPLLPRGAGRPAGTGRRFAFRASLGETWVTRDRPWLLGRAWSSWPATT